MSRLTVCLILLTGTLHAGDIEPLVLTEGLTNASLSQEKADASADSELLQTVFEEAEPADVSVIEPAGTICYEQYCRQCDCRTWTARAGAIHWRPDADDGGLSGVDLDANFGPYLSLNRHGDWADLEFIFFYVDDMDASLTFGPLFTAELEAELQNYEINVKRQAVPHVNLLTGIRVVSLDYSASLTGQQVVLGGIFARNRLIGWQLGVEAELYKRGPFSIDTTWKGGVYHNNAKTSIVIPNMGSLVNDGGETSFLTDFWFNMNYQLSEHTAVRGGYSLMYIDPTADLLAATQGILGGGGSFISEDILLHGFHLMLEFSY